MSLGLATRGYFGGMSGPLTETPTIEPSSLTPSDATQGGIGIYGTFRTRDDEEGELITTLLRFDEGDDPISGDGSPARDMCRGLDDAYAPTGFALPTKTIGAVGLAALFDGTTAYEAKDLISGGTLHTRNVSVMAILSFDVVAQNAAGTPGTIIARGLGTSVSEYMPFAIELEVIDPTTRETGVRFLWQNLSGVLKTQTAASFIAPESGFFQITATRRWVALDEVSLRYYVNDRIIDEVTSVDGEIGGGTAGHTNVGTRYTGAAYEQLFFGAIDEIAIFNYEVSLEEIEATWLRISKYQPDGYRQIRDLMPPNLPISDDPDTQVQTDLRTLGMALGFASARVENMRDNMMPDRAYGPVLQAWERITEQPPGPSDSIDRRRRRVVGHLSQRAGVSPPGVRTALEELLDCDGDDLEIIAFDNTIRDDFATLDDQRWRAQPAANWTADANTLRGQVGAGDYTAPLDFRSCVVPFENPRGNVNDTTTLGGLHFFTAMQATLLPANTEAGIMAWDFATNTALLFGRRNEGGVMKLGWQGYENGLSLGAFTVLATGGAAGLKHWLRVIPSEDQTGIAAAEQKYDLAWATVSSAEADFTTSTVTWRRRFGWAGYYMRSFATAASGIDVRFDELALRNSKGTRPFYFYVYRDPALGGSPDIAGANRVLQRMAHAFTHAYVIESLSLLTDDPGSVVDGGPLGGL